MPVVDGRVFLSQLMNNFGDRMGDSKGFLGYEILDFGFWADFGFWVVDFDFGWWTAVVVVVVVSPLASAEQSGLSGGRAPTSDTRVSAAE